MPCEPCSASCAGFGRRLTRTPDFWPSAENEAVARRAARLRRASRRAACAFVLLTWGWRPRRHCPIDPDATGVSGDARSGGGGGGGGLKQPPPPPKARMKGTALQRSPVPPSAADHDSAPGARAQDHAASARAGARREARRAAAAGTTEAVAAGGGAGCAGYPPIRWTRRAFSRTRAIRTVTGPGTGSGAGTGQGTGIGEGTGSGIGPGSGGGTGGGPYRPAFRHHAAQHHARSTPRLYGGGAASRLSGDVELEIVVRADGTVGNVKLLRGLGGGLDQRAVEAVRAVEILAGETVRHACGCDGGSRGGIQIEIKDQWPGSLGCRN